MERFVNRETHHVNPQIFIPETCTNKPPYIMKEEFLFDHEAATATSKGGYLHEFQHLDNQFHGIGSSSSTNPMFGVQTGSSNYDPFDAFPYGSSSTSMEFYDQYYEKKPFAFIADHGPRGSNVMDNFQSEGTVGGGYNLMNHHLPQRNSITPNIDIVGSSFNLQEMKPLSNYGVPDEVSSATHKHDYFKRDGASKNRLLNPTRKSWKGRKKSNVVKGQWTIDEDRLLIQLVEQYGVRKWSHIAQMLPGRIGKQCRERWHNHLRPDIKKDTWTDEEDKILIQAHTEIGNKWAEIAKRLPGRTENSIKNHWNATKRRQFSKRKCRSKYPRGTLLQEYIKSLNLDATSSGRSSKGKASNAGDNSVEAANPTVKSPNESKPLVAYENDQLVPDYDFSEVPDFEFDDKIFQDGCSIDNILNEMPGASLGEKKSFGMDVPAAEDVTPPCREFGAKEEIDLMEMISQAKM
ncbi:hypothetical protein Tsubulata_002960 [Turnera subulata]|uniref:Uncharacterized protein n=1 Tax=Turnera subulata TaxID=218843 RepID=A0A9Q0JFV6_9ROSI|nr:hypothetical protein Tsubulata_002960 [Turnera subulata]